MSDQPDALSEARLWAEELAASEAEAVAGLSVPGETVHRGLREAIDRLATADKTVRRPALQR